MTTFDGNIALRALEALGSALAEDHDVPSPRIRIVLAGGVACMLHNVLPPTRVTADCDVIQTNPSESWNRLKERASQVGEDLGLPANWLNEDCGRYRCFLPPGWKDRIQLHARFGPLDVCLLSRRDLMCLKLSSARNRPQDREDLRGMSPDEDELTFATQYLTQREGESLNREVLDWERGFLDTLRSRDSE